MTSPNLTLSLWIVSRRSGKIRIGNGPPKTSMVECACPGGWIAYNDNYGKWCFLISAEKRSWYSAAAECQSWNAHLAKIDSMDELMFLSKEIDNAPHLTSSHFWIGGKDSALWNKFEWTSTGTFVDQGFTYWWPGEPNNLGNTERCLEIRHGSSYRDTWNDEDCPFQYHFICKKSSLDYSNFGVAGGPSNINLQHNIYNQNSSGVVNGNSNNHDFSGTNTVFIGK
ncbi:hypothetical protein FSP39_013704 [Pinctada imbricata]|uniref:C-type lectin domain-containing protein n=1 Tax=Pinctada imbricata TaxID=66713 RepID=A0AA88Y545_PINIB|nr:hypothetical protein FSP39_013704 [Pinctada imbricata]